MILTQFNASFKALPGRNFGTEAALIVIVAPVAGLRPLLSARLETSKVPKPTKETESPFFKEAVMASMVDSRARVAAALEISASAAICSMSSDLFTKAPLTTGVYVRLMKCLQRRDSKRSRSKTLDGLFKQSDDHHPSAEHRCILNGFV